MSRPPLRSLVRTFVAVALAVAIPAAPEVARAQQPGAGAPMPLAVDLAKVQIGLWAEYAMTVGAAPAMKSRLALVAKTPETHTLEMSVEGGMMAMAGGKMVVQTVLDAAKGGNVPTVKKVVMQLGANEPMEMPPEAAKQSQFTKPNPKTLVGSETVRVQAGSFKTKHYRDKTPRGDTIDYWISDTVPPLGLVKLTGEQKGTTGAQGPVTLELVALGKEAKAVITKPAKPYDEGRLRQQIMSGAGASHGAPAGGGAGAAASPGAPPAKK